MLTNMYTSEEQRFSIATVWAPIAVVATALGSIIAIGNLTDPSNTSSIEFGWVSMMAASLGAAALFASMLRASIETFRTDRHRFGPVPLAVAAATAAVTVSSTVADTVLTDPTPIGAGLALAAIGLLAALIGHRSARSLLGVNDLPEANAPAPPEVLRRGSDRTVIWAARACPQRFRSFAVLLLSAAVYLVFGLWSWKFNGSVGTAVRVWFLGGWFALIHGFQIASVRVRLTFGPAGLTIRSGLLRRVIVHVEPAHIASAWFTDCPKPNLWTSYGKSSSRKRLSFLTRPGPGLMVKLTDGSDVVVSLDHPEEAAAVINDLLDRRPLTSALPRSA
jgi:hypothetical protein